jgi:hypothetical protein
MYGFRPNVVYTFLSIYVPLNLATDFQCLFLNDADVSGNFSKTETANHVSNLGKLIQEEEMLNFKNMTIAMYMVGLHG